MKKLLALILLASTTTACVTDLDAADDGDPGTESPGKVTLNSLLPGNVHGTTLGTAALTASAAASLASTAGGRSLLSYMVDCGFNSTQSITVVVGGTNYTFTGAMGLQPNWANKGMNAADRALVSACVFSRTNYYGTSVSISDRGASTTLTATPTELTNYVLEEGAFYGDILSSTSGTAHACIGYDAMNHPTTGDLVNRICTEQNGTTGQTNCGFVYDGACALACTTTVAGSGYYDNCNGFTNVVTDFVQN